MSNKKVVRFEKPKHPVSIKSINPTTEVKEEKYVKEILQALMQKPSEKRIQKNLECLEMLRKARRG